MSVCSWKVRPFVLCFFVFFVAHIHLDTPKNKNRFMGHRAPKDEIIGGMAADPSFLPEVGGNITVPQVFFFIGLV